MEANDRIEERLTALEGALSRARAQSRRRGRLLGALAVVGVASLALSFRQGAPQEVILRDATGAKRLWLGALANGGAGLGLYDGNGRTRAELALAPRGNVDLLFFDAEGRTRAHMGLAADGTPRVQLADANAQPALLLEVAADGSRRLRLGAPADAREAELRILPDGRPGLEMRGPDATGRLSLGLDSAHGAELQLRDAKGRGSFSRP